MDPDPTPSFIEFKDAKSIFFHIFLRTCPQAHHLQSKKVNFLLKLLCSNVILQALFQSARHIYEKREGSGSVPLTNGFGSPTLAVKHEDLGALAWCLDRVYNKVNILALQNFAFLRIQERFQYCHFGGPHLVGCIEHFATGL